MTATRIRETPDGVLYRLSEPVEYTTWDVEYFKTSTEWILVQHMSMYGEWNGTVVRPASEGGAWDYHDIVASEFGITDPDAMIEAMGYTVLQEEL